MICQEKLEAYLRENGVSYEIQHHSVAFTARQVAASEGLSAERLAKVVMVFAGERLAMLVLPASERVHLPSVARILGERDVRLAEEGEFVGVFADCVTGAMPPFGNLYNIPVYVDRLLTENETLYFQVGTHTETMSMRYADFERLVRPAVGEFSWEETAVYHMG